MGIRSTSDPSLEPMPSRQLICVACGASFECALDGTCWCAHESVRLPMPASGGDCLCPRCLRETARLQGIVETGI
jgi:hypothetical protein